MDVVNILIFQAAVLLAYFISVSMQKSSKFDSIPWQVLGVVVHLAVVFFFVLWTAAPPDLPLFTDPTNGTRGIPQSL